MKRVFRTNHVSFVETSFPGEVGSPVSDGKATKSKISTTESNYRNIYGEVNYSEEDYNADSDDDTDDNLEK